jgi:hypothetical protein
MDSGAIPIALRRIAVARGPKPQSIIRRVAPISSTIALPELPLPSVHARIIDTCA